VERGHRHRGEGDEGRQPAAQLVGCAFFLLDELLGLLQCLVADDGSAFEAGVVCSLMT